MKTKTMFGALCSIILLGACSDAGNSAASAEGAATSAAAVHPGENVYNTYCVSCHGAGLAGAPALGDVEAWAPRIAKGSDLLLQSTIDGILPQMPPRGLCSDCSDEQLADVVDYMMVKSR